MIEGVESVDASEAPFDARVARPGLKPQPLWAELGRRLGGVTAGAQGDLLETVMTARGPYWRLKAAR